MPRGRCAKPLKFPWWSYSGVMTAYRSRSNLHGLADLTISQQSCEVPCVMSYKSIMLAIANVQRQGCRSPGWTTTDFRCITNVHGDNVAPLNLLFALIHFLSAPLRWWRCTNYLESDSVGGVGGDASGVLDGGRDGSALDVLDGRYRLL